MLPGRPALRSRSGVQSRPSSFLTRDQGMRGLWPWAFLTRSIVRASSMSSMVSCIWRSKDVARATCLSSSAQLASGLERARGALLINVFSVANIIDHHYGAFQLKKHAVVTGAETVFVLEALELLHIARQVCLCTVYFPADETAGFLRQCPQLVPGRGHEFNFVAHGGRSPQRAALAKSTSSCKRTAAEAARIGY